MTTPIIRRRCRRSASASRTPGSPPPRGDVDVTLDEDDRFGPLVAIRTPGHAPDHLAYLVDGVALTGDAVLRVRGVCSSIPIRARWLAIWPGCSVCVSVRRR